MTPDQTLTIEEKERFFGEIDRKSNKITGYTMIAYFIFGIFLSFFYSTYTIAIGVGGLSITAYFLTRSLLPDSSFSQYVASGVYAVFAAQFIYQMHGLFEMHFFVFVGTAILITYQNWKLQLPLILLVVIHHATFAYLQYSGNKEIYFTQLDYMDLQAFLFHGGLAAVISAICGYWGYDLERKTLKDATNTVMLEKQLSNVKNNIAFAEEISKGNLAVEYNLLDNSDELGKSLVSMRKNLLESSEREQKEKFTTVGITKVGDIIRKHNDNVKELCDEFIQSMVKYLGINQGGVFLLETIDNEEVLNLTACYAYDRKKYLNRTVSKDEGLIGQCFQERDVIYMTDIPRDYAKITSGLGESRPTSILIVPIKTSDDIVGVLELASLKPFETNHIEFITRAAENIASSITSSRITERVKKLLEESQQQTEEMRSQEEEMRQNMEEMQATQEEIHRTSSEVESRIQAVNESGIGSIEFELDGTIVTANNTFLKMTGYTLNEIQGKHHRIFASQTYTDSQAYKKFWQDLSRGIASSGEYERLDKNGIPVVMKGAYSIIRDRDGKPKRVLKLVTECKIKNSVPVGTN